METEHLEVHQLDDVDVLKDMARLHKSQRGSLSLGTICIISVGDKNRFLSVRGLPDAMLEARNLPIQDPKYILLDETVRDHLGLELGKKYRFKITPARWWGRIRWAYSASDPAASVAAFIATWSFILAILGTLLAIWSICLSWK